MKKSELQQIIREEIAAIIKEAAGHMGHYSGAMSGTQEKEFSTGLRNIHNKFQDSDRSINNKTNHSIINYGGCGIFAQLLYYNMRKYLGITPKIVVLDYGHHDALPAGVINRYKSLFDFNNDDNSCIHIVLQVNDYYIDSSGIHKFQWFENQYHMNLTKHEGMTIQTLVRWTRSSHNWNPSFNRYDTGDINDDMVASMKRVRDLGLSKK